MSATAVIELLQKLTCRKEERNGSFNF